jgi:hypothetical protein
VTWEPDYITSAQLKSYARISHDVDDAEVALAVTAASRAVDGACSRQFGQVAASTEWLFTANWNGSTRRWHVPIEDLASSAGLTVTIDGTASTAYTLRPTRAVAKGRVYIELVFDDAVSVSGDIDAIALTSDQWGWTTPPPTVVEASLIQGSRFLARRDSPFGIAGSPDSGSEMRLLSRLDPDVRMMLVAAKLVRLVAA